MLKTEKDSVLVTGTVTDEEEDLRLQALSQTIIFGNFLHRLHYKKANAFCGNAFEFLNMATIELEDTKTLNEVVITGKADDVSSKLDKKDLFR